MRHARWICLLVALLAAGAWAQEAEPPEKPAQAENTTVAVAPEDAPQLSEKDRLLACPANIQFHADMRTTVDGESLSKIGGSVKPPKPTNQVAAMFSDEARRIPKKKHLTSFQSIVTRIVDAQGNPQNVCVVKPA